MEQIVKSKKCCGTCAYWLGYRIPNRLHFIEVNSVMEKGQCSAHALTENYYRQACYCCRMYEKWPGLK